MRPLLRQLPRPIGCLLLAAVAALPGRAIAETIAIPVTVDYPMLESILLRQAYTGPGGVAVPVDESGGCSS